MRRDAAKAQDYAQRHGVARSYSDLDSLLKDPDVNAVYVATPPGSHLEIGLQVAAAGKPCYMEKPMARNYQESARLAAAFSEAGVPLFAAYYRRAYPRFIEVRALLERGELGELSGVHYTMRRPPPKLQPGDDRPAGWRHSVATSGGGLFVDVGSHLLDVIDFLVGPLRSLRGVAARAPGAPADAVEDVVSASFLAGRAAIGSATWNFRASDSFELLELVGDKGRLLLPDALNGAECVLEFADGSPARRWTVPPPAPAVQEPLIQTVVDALQAGDATVCPSTAESALRTGQYLDTLLQDFYGSRADGFWEDPSSWAVNTDASGPDAGEAQKRLRSDL